VVCSACGFENPSGMRFCGMCGMPLPHRPLTTPGAQSTLHLTRVPREGDADSPGRSTAPGAAANPGANVVESPLATAPPVEEADVLDPMPSSLPDFGTTELVPDVPLDEYLQSFRYQPPSEPTEITMRGDATEQAAYAAYRVEETTVAPSSPADLTAPADAIALASTTETETPPVIAAAPPDTVESRLGLEPEVPAEVHSQRPNFLDLSEPPRESKPAKSRPITIAGPSFLGLSDTAETGIASRLPKPRKLRRYYWGAWSAAAVVLLLATLGLMEWRSQVDQTNDGPVEVIAAKVHNWSRGPVEIIAAKARDLAPIIDRWRQRLLSAGRALAPASSAGDTNAQPEMPARSRNHRGLASAPAGAPAISTAATAAAQPGTVAGTTPGPKPPANNLNSTAPSETTPISAAKPKPPRQTAISSQEAATKPDLLGAEEIVKARNASDAAAAAAWLWKATAKGNPDAPVQLADMYIKGDGVPRSCEQAVVLLKTAAEKENGRARNRLASMYSTGTCVQRDRVQAYRWLSSALVANPNSEWAQQNRDLIWQQMTPEERVLAEKYR
jgi:Sel1 repeat-containing protein